MENEKNIIYGQSEKVESKEIKLLELFTDSTEPKKLFNILVNQAALSSEFLAKYQGISEALNILEQRTLYSAKINKLNELLKNNTVSPSLFVDLATILAKKNAEIKFLEKTIAEQEQKRGENLEEYRKLYEEEENLNKNIKENISSGRAEEIISLLYKAGQSAGDFEENFKKEIESPEYIKLFEPEELMKKEVVEEETGEEIDEETLMEAIKTAAPSLLKDADNVSLEEIEDLINDFLILDSPELKAKVQPQIQIDEKILGFLRLRVFSFTQNWIEVWARMILDEEKEILEEQINKIKGEAIKRALRRSLKPETENKTPNAV